MKFRRRAGNVAREEVFLNLTSFIDVIFVLLLFFVVTTTFSRPSEMKIELPEAVSGTPTEATTEKTLELSISADGQYALNGQVLVKNDLTTLMNALGKESGGDNSLPMIISADAKTTHQSVITAMDAAGKLGFSKLRITTVEAQPEKP
ncbi:biopolymer transporter ExbD [Pseudomonas sp. 1D4]|uniref:Biopolymer transporter ExbD n=1 Tax=Metapseudomonas otitidis TaxID=319939 RepID=A0A1I0TE10_9GAMM|nr:MULTISPECIES: biopolymer transporter ExbD [Pseudomonas]MDL5595865.1 biopolymer transporter ExbD [Bacillus subtilis]KIV72135.1 Biopolymer transport protein ExbD/TolR [Pseudomonas sp. FeS53a]MBO2928149.1 biopolymer transporter ExbD [Pseudomonas otitidis]MCP1617650.1 biopolymer transport protein ExbD [Pseudomonas otitidis]MDG9782891.1 biopolymer transporter ExbD [Pseudomonas otitidis]